MPQLSDEEYAAFVGKNRELYCVPAEVEEVREEIVESPAAPAVSPLHEEPISPPPPTGTISAAPEPVLEHEKISVAPVEPKAKKEALRPPPVQPTEMVLGRGGREPKYLQQLLKQVAEDRGFRAIIEREISGGAGSVDLSIEREDIKDRLRDTITSTPEQELGNVKKCLAAGYNEVILLSSEKKQLDKLKKVVSSAFQEEELRRILFLLPEAFISHLDQLAPAERRAREPLPATK